MSHPRSHSPSTPGVLLSGSYVGYLAHSSSHPLDTTLHSLRVLPGPYLPQRTDLNNLPNKPHMPLRHHVTSTSAHKRRPATRAHSQPARSTRAPAHSKPPGPTTAAAVPTATMVLTKVTSSAQENVSAIFLAAARCTAVRFHGFALVRSFRAFDQSAEAPFRAEETFSRSLSRSNCQCQAWS